VAALGNSDSGGVGSHAALARLHIRTLRP
jgi:hypothetical protein